MHLVHFNTRYPDPTEAGLHPDGFAVLGTFFDDVEDDEYNNQELNKIVLQLREISEFNTTTTMKRSLNLRNLLPRDIDTFYTYPRILDHTSLFRNHNLDHISGSAKNWSATIVQL